MFSESFLRDFFGLARRSRVVVEPTVAASTDGKVHLRFGSVTPTIRLTIANAETLVSKLNQAIQMAKHAVNKEK